MCIRDRQQPGPGEREDHPDHAERGDQHEPGHDRDALVLQFVTIVAGFVLVTPLGVVGVIFAIVWAVLLLMRRDVARRMARGELPGQRGG